MREIRLVRGVENDPVKKIEPEKSELKTDKTEKGILTKPEPKLEKLDKKLEKIEKKTDELIKKAKAVEERRDITKSSSSGNIVIGKSTVGGNKNKGVATKKQPSYIEFLCLKGIPKAIARHISQNMTLDPVLNCLVCIIDSEEINDLILKNEGSKKNQSQDIANTVYRMQASGWFETIYSSNNGTRIVRIHHPEYFKP